MKPPIITISTEEWRAKGTGYVEQARASGDIILVTSHAHPRVLVFPIRERLPAVGPRRHNAIREIGHNAHAIREDLGTVSLRTDNQSMLPREIGITRFRRDLADAMWQVHDSKAAFLTIRNRPVALLVPVQWLTPAKREAMIASIGEMLYG